jgi:hypothetical protein
MLIVVIRRWRRDHGEDIEANELTLRIFQLGEDDCGTAERHTELDNGARDGSGALNRGLDPLQLVDTQID